MRRGIVAGAAVLGGLVLGLAPAARAESWADALFSEKGIDFGPVPRGSKVRHAFVLTNKFAEPITILDVRASCGCTSGRAGASVVPPGGQATVEAEMDTRNFVGRKATTLTVTVATARGKQAEVRLAVASTILSDIVLNPGTIDFGSVARGRSARQTLTIERHGAPTWRAERMVAEGRLSRLVEASLQETKRSAERVAYTLTVQLKPDAPAGAIRDEIRILTNDRESPFVPVLVTAQVRGDLSASPGLLALGKVTSAGGVQGKVLVRGSKPFQIRSIDGGGDGFSAVAAASGSRALHVVTVSYKPEAGTTRGDLRRTFRITTDLPGEPPLEVQASLHVDP